MSKLLRPSRVRAHVVMHVGLAGWNEFIRLVEINAPSTVITRALKKFKPELNIKTVRKWVRVYHES